MLFWFSLLIIPQLTHTFQKGTGLENRKIKSRLQSKQPIPRIAKTLEVHTQFLKGFKVDPKGLEIASVITISALKLLLLLKF